MSGVTLRRPASIPPRSDRRVGALPVLLVIASLVATCASPAPTASPASPSATHVPSPAASSQLFAHSSGRLFWFGNICPVNPTGNRPRYPFIMGEVDRRSGLLDKTSIRVIDDRAAHETSALQLSSPSTREDRETGEILLNLTRFSEFAKDAEHDWTANAYLYRMAVD